MNDRLLLAMILAGPAGFIVVAVRRGWLTRPHGHFTGLTVYHDWLNQDAQRGTEVIIQRSPGAKAEEDASADPPAVEDADQ